MEGDVIEKKKGNEQMRDAWVTFGTASHEGEYVFSIEGSSTDKDIAVTMGQLELELKKELGEDWQIDNRGTRIEIFRKERYGQRDDQAVHAAIRKVLATRNLKLNIQ